MTKSAQLILVLAILSFALFLAWLLLPPSTNLFGFVTESGSGTEQKQAQSEFTDSSDTSKKGVRAAAAKSSVSSRHISTKNAVEPETTSPVASHRVESMRVQRQVSADPEERRVEGQNPQYVIAGLAQDEDGKPLANIEVLAGLIHTAGAADLKEDSELAAEQSTWTDYDGFFVFEDLVDGEYRIKSAPMDGFAPAETKARVGVLSANLVLVQMREIRLVGMVSSQDGNPLDEVRVIAGPPTRVTDTDAEGDYELDISIKGENRAHTIHFRREGYRDQSVRLHPADLDDFLDYFELDVSMEPLEGLTTVTGRLTDPEGLPVAGKIINIRSPRLKNSYRAQSDMKGQFSLKDVEPGRDYQLAIRPGANFRDYERAQMEIPVNGLQVDIVLEPLDQGELFGFMTDVNGRPVSGFSLTLQSKAAAGQSIQVVSDSTGFFEVKKFPAGGALLKTNSYPVFETQGFNVSPEIEEPVPVVLDIGQQSLVGQVQNVFGETVAASEVSLGWQHSENGVHNYSARKTTADQNGIFMFNGLGPGEHTLRVNAPGFSMAVITINVGMDSDNVIVELEEES